MAYPGLNIRSGPGQTGTQILGSLPYQQWGTVYCYYTGTYVYGDPYWDYGFYNGIWGYVADYYLNTGGDITTQVDPGPYPPPC
jgi:hypothetical protein